MWMLMDMVMTLIWYIRLSWLFYISFIYLMHAIQIYCDYLFMPLPSGPRGIVFLGCPSVHLSVRPKPEIPSFHLYMGLLVYPIHRDRFMACPSVCPSIRLSVRPSGEISGYCQREWPEILHADVSWPSDLIRLWSWSVEFPLFDATLT